MQVKVKQRPAPTQPYDGNGKFIEGERQRLAQEIHDGLIQELTGAVLQLEICEKVYTLRIEPKILFSVTKKKSKAKAVYKPDQ